MLLPWGAQTSAAPNKNGMIFQLPGISTCRFAYPQEPLACKPPFLSWSPVTSLLSSPAALLQLHRVPFSVFSPVFRLEGGSSPSRPAWFSHGTLWATMPGRSSFQTQASLSSPFSLPQAQRRMDEGGDIPECLHGTGFPQYRGSSQKLFLRVVGPAPDFRREAGEHCAWEAPSSPCLSFFETRKGLQTPGPLVGREWGILCYWGMPCVSRLHHFCSYQQPGPILEPLGAAIKSFAW